jgi:hypothetical protein
VLILENTPLGAGGGRGGNISCKPFGRKNEKKGKKFEKGRKRGR